MPAWVLSGDVNLGSIDLEGQLLSMGRSEQRDVILKDKAASRLLRDPPSEGLLLASGFRIRKRRESQREQCLRTPTARRGCDPNRRNGVPLSFGRCIGIKTDVLGGETSTQSDGDHTRTFVNVMEPNVGWSLDSPEAEEPSPQAFATPMPPAFPRGVGQGSGRHNRTRG